MEGGLIYARGVTLKLDDEEALEARVRAILPETYQDRYEEVQPVSMGSAGLKYDADGKVAWDEIWGSFCDLAMAGGPPHKGALLEPGTVNEIAAHGDRYGEVTEEICRGVRMVTDLRATPGAPGWVSVDCGHEALAGWLGRAIVMENIAVRVTGQMLELPAGPHYRLEKEIKNVVTAAAKTCHYWVGHMRAGQQREIDSLFRAMGQELPLVQPGLGNEALQRRMAGRLQGITGLRPSAHEYANWLGLECGDVRAAIWMMRAMVASNVLARREGTVLFVPVNATSDPEGETVVGIVARVCAFARARGFLAAGGG